MKYLIVIEKSKSGYSAFSPDVPGCAAVGETRKETEKNIKEAIEFHIESLREDGQEAPVPTCDYTYVEVAA